MLAVHERQPLAAAVVARRATYSVPSSRRSRLASGRPDRIGLGHELVEILELLIVAHVDDGAAVGREHRRRAFVLESPERRALLRPRLGTNGSSSTIQPNLRLSAGFAPSRSAVRELPAIRALALPEAEAAMHELRRGIEHGRGAVAEVVVDVLFGGEVGAPRRRAGRQLLNVPSASGTDSGRGFSNG